MALGDGLGVQYYKAEAKSSLRYLSCIQPVELPVGLCNEQFLQSLSDVRQADKLESWQARISCDNVCIFHRRGLSYVYLSLARHRSIASFEQW